MTTAFEPHPLIPGGQLQTLVAYCFAAAPRLAPQETLFVTLGDGDRLSLDVNYPHEVSDRTPIVYLMHGLGGCSESAYKLRIAAKLTAQGFRVVRHNHRGCGRFGEGARGIYHSGSTLDVLAGLREVAQRWSDAPLLPIGFSLSGTMLLNLLGTHLTRREELPQVQAAMSVCAPIDLHQSSAAIGALRNKHFDTFYSRTLIRQLLGRRIIDSAFAETELRAANLRLIDEIVTAPRGGFRDAEHYYESCSPKHVVANIRIPTLVLEAADDPIVPPQSVVQAAYSTRALLSLERSGGHLGFISREPTAAGDHRWLDQFIGRWVREQSRFRG
jgi:predicted alpha/beta-fold hydrolase